MLKFVRPCSVVWVRCISSNCTLFCSFVGWARGKASVAKPFYGNWNALMVNILIVFFHENNVWIRGVPCCIPWPANLVFTLRWNFDLPMVLKAVKSFNLDLLDTFEMLGGFHAYDLFWVHLGLRYIRGLHLWCLLQFVVFHAITYLSDNMSSQNITLMAVTLM